jgi:hypothetical protein
MKENKKAWKLEEMGVEPNEDNEINDEDSVEEQDIV